MDYTLEADNLFHIIENDTIKYYREPWIKIWTNESGTLNIERVITDSNSKGFYTNGLFISRDRSEDITFQGTKYYAWAILYDMGNGNVTKLGVFSSIDYGVGTHLGAQFYAINTSSDQIMAQPPTDVEVINKALIQETYEHGIENGNIVRLHGLQSLSSDKLVKAEFRNLTPYVPFKCFYNCNALSSVTMPDTITLIGSDAFRGCTALTSVTLPQQLNEIGDRSFGECNSLTNIDIPENVKKIYSYAFASCENLTSVSLPKGIEFIDKNAFLSYNSGLTIQYDGRTADLNNVNWDRTYTPSAVTCEDGKFLLVNSQTTLDEQDEAIAGIRFTKDITEFLYFSNFPNLHSIYIPSGLTEMDLTPLYDLQGLDMESIKVEEGNEFLHSGNDSKSLIYEMPIPEEMREEYFGLETIRLLMAICKNAAIPEDVNYIGSIFNNTSGLTSVNLDNVAIITNSFNNCPGLTAIHLSNELHTIYESFGNCENLRELYLSSQCTANMMEAFTNCPSLTSIIVDSNNTFYDSRNNCNAIINTSGNTLVLRCGSSIIPDTVSKIGNSAFYECTSLTSVNLPSGLTAFGENAFMGCTSLTSISMPSSLNEIGMRGFMACSGLTSISLNQGISQIGEYAFMDCTNLMSINIPSSLSEISEGCFYSCSSLASVNLPNNISKIGYGAFKDCSSLTSIDIPSGMTIIEERTFQGCTSLSSVTLPDTVNTISDSSFMGCTSLTTITFNNVFMDVYSDAFADSGIQTIYYCRTKEYWDEMAISRGAIPDGTTIVCTDVTFAYEYKGTTQ